MGCDIHMYVEYMNKTRVDKAGQWTSFGGRFNPGRDYSMFGFLAGVRDAKAEQAFEQRGLPRYESLGFSASWDAFLRVDDEHPDADRCCSSDSANGYGEVFTVGKMQLVQNPDWHSHSWLNALEFRAVLMRYKSAYPNDCPKEYWAVLAAMESLEENGSDVRVVFWFDN